MDLGPIDYLNYLAPHITLLTQWSNNDDSNFKFGFSAKFDFKTLIGKMEIGGQTVESALGSLASGIPNIQAEVAIQV